MPPKTPAERQKKYREKLKKENPQKYEERRLKHLEKVKENIKKKKMSLSEAEKLEQLKKWRMQNSDRAKKRKEEKVRQGSLKTVNTAASYNNNDTKKKNDKNNRFQKLIEENMELKRKNANLRRQNFRYKREIINLKQKLTVNNSSESAIVTAIRDETPITKSNNFVEATIPTASAEEKEKVKKKLVLLNTLTESIKINYEKADTKEKKDVLKNLATHEMVNKYKQKTNITEVLGLKGRIRIIKAKNRLGQKYRSELNAFFKREDVTRPSAGKNECITKNKNKMQKRYLTEPLYKLHKKYKAEGGRASFQTFCRFRPFYVVHPKIQDRNTCACVKHTNMLFKTTALKRLGVLQSSDLGDILGEVTCSASFKCFYSECMDCKDKIPTLNTTIDTNLPIQWQQWKIVTHTYTKVTKGKSEEKQTKKYAKTPIKGTVGNLIKEFLKDLKQFKTHHYNVNHQYQSWKKCIENLEDDEVVLVCDFSENFACKQAEEIQAVHFGASRNQITLHTSVLYTKNKKPLSICSISPINEHGPGAIWAHLDPIAQYCIKELKAKKIHVFSDSPATQYRQKNNFYMFQKRCSDYGFKFGTWNFFEASHGKGPADGVGGAIKRQLDNQIAHGHDITDAKDAYDYLKNNTKIKIFYIPENKVDEMMKMIPNDVVPIKGTMKVHQIATNGDGSIKYKWLSCFDCEKNTCCDCYYTKEHQLMKTNILAATLLKNKKDESHEKQSKSNNKGSNEEKHKAQKRQRTQTRRVPAKKRKRSKSSSTSISDDAMSIYSESDCIDLDEEEDVAEVNTDNEYENRNKENVIGKVTILSSIRNAPENRRYFNLQKFDPLRLHQIDKNFDLSTVNALKKTKHTWKSDDDNTVCDYPDLDQSLRKSKHLDDGRSNEGNESKESLRTKNKGDTSKSAENVMSKNDKETQVISDDKYTYQKKVMKETNIENTGDSETKDVKDYEDAYLKTAMKENTEKDYKIEEYRETEDDKDNGSTYLKITMKENSAKNKDQQETENVKDNEGTYLKIGKMEKTEIKYKNKDERVTDDDEDKEGIYLKTIMKEKSENSTRNKDQRETEKIKDNEGIYLKTVMKEKTEIKYKKKDERETGDDEDNEGTYLETTMKEKSENSTRNKDQRETEKIKDIEGIYLKTVMKEKTEIKYKKKDERETGDDEDNEGTYLETTMKEKSENSTRNKDQRETEKIKDIEGIYLKTVMKEKTEIKYKKKDERETDDDEDNEGTYLETTMKEKSENSTKNKAQQETEKIKDNEGSYLKTAMKAKQIINKYDGHIKEIVVGLSINEDIIKNDVNIETKDNQKNEIFKLGDTILVRYYKKTWKYYVGVITQIHYGENMYSISYYKSRGKEANVKFVVPKIKDVDCVPHVNIVKKIELLKKEGSLSLINIEDAVYF